MTAPMTDAECLAEAAAKLSRMADDAGAETSFARRAAGEPAEIADVLDLVRALDRADLIPSDRVKALNVHRKRLSVALGGVDLLFADDAQPDDARWLVRLIAVERAARALLEATA